MMNTIFICEECKKPFKTLKGLSIHLTTVHKLNHKNYFDKWLKHEETGICKHCGNITKFKGTIASGYNAYCSHKCFNLHKYGVSSFFKTKNFKKKRKESLIKKYGVEEPLQNKDLLEKRKQTNLKKYGFFTPKLNKMVNQKYKETCFKKYGVENIMHREESFEKMQKNSRVKKKFKNTNIWYQGSYELDFLEKYYDKYPDIVRGPSIKYKYKGKNKVYYSDFYIPTLNLIVECKSMYFYIKHKEINEVKRKYTIKNGYQYLLILDKNYKNL